MKQADENILRGLGLIAVDAIVLHINAYACRFLIDGDRRIQFHRDQFDVACHNSVEHWQRGDFVTILIDKRIALDKGLLP